MIHCRVLSDLFNQEGYNARTQHHRYCRTCLVGFAIKLFFFAAPPAEAEMRNSLDISRMHAGKNLPVQKLHDMSFVYSQED